MIKRHLLALLAALLLPGLAWAQQGVVLTDPVTGNQAYVSGHAIDVNLVGGGGTIGTVNQGTQNAGGAAAWWMQAGDGAEVTIGAKADAATCVTTNTLMACLRQIHADLIAALPAGTNIIGKFGIDQTTPGTTNGVQLPPSTHVQCAALCTSLVVKGAAGTLQSFEVSADSTLSAAAWWLLIYDATSKPGDGAVTPAKCYAYPSGTTSAGGTFTDGGVTFATGITAAVSTTGCFTSTSSTHAFLAGDYR